VLVQRDNVERFLPRVCLPAFWMQVGCSPPSRVQYSLTWAVYRDVPTMAHVNVRSSFCRISVDAPAFIASFIAAYLAANVPFLCPALVSFSIVVVSKPGV